ncbi:hypothetical protein CCM_06399 [Cordyceps militaris CM01]|uniref:Uncharacterized protein n=1 Tax=Cordyceps militaris (strain CM01) TaxID=983644 RepID=G3JKG0_CORMM|nr:uncharacterized protein CCM_06399 [Cordyceps militaris CM01]EGX92238.1 hypothetical protein CCM_06399 [Cordyceps militaris CM01]
MSTHEAEMGAITEASSLRIEQHESESESGNSLAEKEGAGCEPRSAISITRNRHVHAKKAKIVTHYRVVATRKTHTTHRQRRTDHRLYAESVGSPGYEGAFSYYAPGHLQVKLAIAQEGGARQLNSSSAQADPFLSLAQVHEFDIIRYNTLNNQSLRMRPHALHYKVKVSYAKPFSVTNELLGVFRGPSPHVLQNRRY